MQLRSRLQQASPLYNLFQITPGSWATEWISHGGVESITLDLQHGMIEHSDMLPMLQAMRAGGSIPLVRLAWNRPELIMKALDYGVEGLICPMIDSAAEAAAFVRAAKYPPLGNRSFGPFRASIMTEEYFSTANTETLCFSMIETAGAVQDLEAIAATPGLDGIYVGPFDLSVSLGLNKRADFSDPALLQLIDQVLAAAKANNLFTGIFTVNPKDAQAMAERGFDLVTCGTANLVFQNAMREWQATLERIRRD
jgi:4-hydroxy-2-oxoheptanedioate aldolase